MKLKNYQEDLVLYVTDLVLQERPDVEKSESFIHDVAAYTLNRLPPRYIQSERGFTRLAADHWVDSTNGEGLAGLVEVLLLVHKAIETIQHRRKSDGEAAASTESSSPADEVLNALDYWHNLPYMIGRVIDRDRGAPIERVSVSVSLNGRLAEAAEGNWKNPYHTSQATRGFYSFLPKPERSRSKHKSFALRILLEHPQYEPAELERTLHTQGEYARQQVVLSDSILNLGSTVLRRKG